MIVRIRLQQGQPIAPQRGKNRHIALACAALLAPAALMAYVLGFWRLASDMSMAGEFVITGTFSHWQVWIAVAVAVHLPPFALNRCGRGADLPLPRILM